MASTTDGSAVRGWVEQSGLVFSGTVQRENDATMAAVPADAGAAVVRVEHVLKAPEILSGLAGKELTLLPAAGSSVTAGQRAVFFARAWLYGESLAVIEVGRLERAAEKDTAEQDAELDGVRGLIEEADRGVSDEQFQERLRQAEVVVAARVRETHPLQREQPGPFSEHDPLWWEAVLEVGSVEKGQPSEELLTVLFPSSTDEFWIDSPKLAPGMEAVFVLHRDQTERGFPVLRVPGLTALSPLDVQPREALPRVRATLERMR
jgi:hypothetical protein